MEQKYKYYLFKGKVARIEDGEFEIRQKEFYIDGQWVVDKELNMNLNDAIMDYGDYSWNDYEEISEEKAFQIIKEQSDKS